MALLLLGACAGTHFRWREARQVREGMTKEQVVAILGKPYMVSASRTPEGAVREVWTWSFAEGFTMSSKALSLVFIDGRVAQTPVIPAEFKD